LRLRRCPNFKKQPEERIKMNQVVVSPAKSLSDFMEKYKGQIALALPKHITADRMVRLAMTSFSQSPGLQKCDMHSIFSSVVIAAQLGLEIGVGGQGYLVPYKGKATFVPGWQGLVDLVSRAGRATVWTGAVYEGDKFEWALGDNPFVRHQPEGDGDDWKSITHVYAIGRVNGSQYPVIEVWTMNRIVRHLNKFNKVGAMHYALKDNGQNMEMYARKVALLQVLKYMPKSVEVQRAFDVANVADTGKNFTFDGEVVVVTDQEEKVVETVQAKTLETCSPENFDKNKAAWRKAIVESKKTVSELVAMIETRHVLTEDQKLTLDSFSHEMD
jgi:recombination protein RecT